MRMKATMFLALRQLLSQDECRRDRRPRMIISICIYTKLIKLIYSTLIITVRFSLMGGAYIEINSIGGNN